jgi:N-glycosylase/DNA lyase
MKEAQWFTVNYSNAANKMHDVYKNYKTYLDQSKGLTDNIVNKFSLEKMNKQFEDIMDKYAKGKPTIVPIRLPKLNKIG